MRVKTFQFLSLKNLENCEHHPGGDGMPVYGPVRRL